MQYNLLEPKKGDLINTFIILPCPTTNFKSLRRFELSSYK